jgi:hypothetical protein
MEVSSSTVIMSLVIHPLTNMGFPPIGILELEYFSDALPSQLD